MKNVCILCFTSLLVSSITKVDATPEIIDIRQNTDSVEIYDKLELEEIKEILAKYFAQKATEEMDKLWEENQWNDETMKKWANEHLRTKSDQ